MIFALKFFYTVTIRWYRLQVSNFIFQLLHSNIDEEIGSSLLINNQIHSHNTNTNNQMSVFGLNRSKTKYCVFHNGIT